MRRDRRVSIVAAVGQALVGARGGRLREWGLFALAAVVPTAIVGALGLRAISSEEAAILRQAQSELQVTAGRAQNQVDTEIAQASSELERQKWPAADPSGLGALEDELRGVIPSFSEPVVLAADRRLLVPRAGSGAASTEGDPRATAGVDRNQDKQDCARLSRELAKQTLVDARVAVRAEILERCQDVRTESGRWLWPIIALDGLSSDEAPAFGAWLDDHAERMQGPEHEATRLEIESAQAIPRSQRDAWLATLAGRAHGHASIERILQEPAVVVALTDASSDLISWRAGRSAGVLLRRQDGTALGFVVHAESLARALDGGHFDVSGDQQAAVRTGPPLDRGELEPGEYSARARVAPELGIELRLAADAFAARASFQRRILGGLAAGGMVVAFAMGALLFARMRAARRSSELRTGFVAAVSHELRTPIASIRMLSELLEQGRVEPEERREVYEALARESKRLGETVDRLLGFSRMAAGRASIERKLEDPAAVVGASVDTFEERHAGVPRVERDLAPSLAAFIDEVQVRLAVDNLLANAHKYAPEGTPYEVSVRRRGAGIAISVRDHGPGIERRHHKRIFQPFERADDRLNQATEGSGIGLSLVEHVARAHGGTVELASHPGSGSTFTIWIPDAEASS